MASQEWITPKIDFQPADQVTPDIFNNLGKSVIHLKETTSGIEYKPINSEAVLISTLVFVEE